MKKSIKKLFTSSSSSSVSSNGKTNGPLPVGATVTTIDSKTFQVETPNTRLVVQKSPADDQSRHMPFSILTALLTNVYNQMADEAKIYGADYSLYRDPGATLGVLNIRFERNTKGGPRQVHKLTYADLLLLCNAVKEFLWKIEDETCEIVIFRRDRYAENGEAVVGKGFLGFTPEAMKQSGGVASNTTDVRW